MISVKLLSQMPLLIVSLSNYTKMSRSSYNLTLTCKMRLFYFNNPSYLFKKLTIYWANSGLTSTDLLYNLLAPYKTAYLRSSSYFIAENSP